MDSTESESDPPIEHGNSVPSPTTHPIELPATRKRREVDEWALVLSAEGFEPSIRRGAAGYRIRVAPDRVESAARILDAWQQERRDRAARVVLPPARSATTFEVAASYALALSLLSFHMGLGFADRYDGLVEAGGNQAGLVLSGDFWRLVTALTLHADLPHVLGNTLFGGFFLSAVAGRLGIGLGTLTFVLTGTLGNLANDLYYGWDHNSIGASTGVFGLVGILTGLAAWRRHQIAGPGRGAWVAFGAGLGIVAMLGTGGPRVDVSAHLFGLVVGAVAGLILAIPLTTRPHPNRRAQCVAFGLAVALILVAWRLALR